MYNAFGNKSWPCMNFDGLKWPQISEKIVFSGRLFSQLVLQHWMRYFLGTGGPPMDATMFYPIKPMEEKIEKKVLPYLKKSIFSEI